jgi:hypothetical protein
MLHVIKDICALPVSCFEISVFGALLGELDFSVGLCQLSVYFFLAFRTDAFCFGHRTPPSVASIINANGRRIIDMVTIRSYFRTLDVDEAEVARRMEQ